MALQVNYKITYGEIKYRQASDNKLYTIKIHSCNALCALIYHYMKDGEKWSQLFSFFANEQHIKNCEKHFASHDCLDLFNGEITSIKLNLYYKESTILLRHFCKHHVVKCYYTEPKNK